VIYDVATKGAAEGELTPTEVGNIGIETEAATVSEAARRGQKP
jgi:hypothetical protein